MNSSYQARALCGALLLLSLFLLSPLARAQELHAPSDCQPDPSELEDIFAYLGDVDCTISSDTGYSQGQPFPIEVVHIGGKAVEKDTANAFLVMQEAAANEGVNIGIVSGFRTYQEQEYLYGCYINCNCNSCNLAARPGYSNHNSGHALDLNTSAPGVYNWLAARGGEFGFERTVPSEDWHWEWWGGGPGGGVCGFEELDCQAIPKAGRVIEENDDCFVAGGDSRYWRHVEEGHGGNLIWTKATASETPSNFAIWQLDFKRAGSYELLVYTDGGAYAQSTQARYRVTHAGEKSVAMLDQSQGEGWQSLGVFDFDTSEGQQIRLNDNTGEEWADDPGGTKLMVDALKIRPFTSGSDPLDEEEESDDESDLAGGCASAGSSSSAPIQAGLLWLLVWLAGRARRRRLSPCAACRRS